MPEKPKKGQFKRGNGGGLGDLVKGAILSYFGAPEIAIATQAKPNNGPGGELMKEAPANLDSPYSNVTIKKPGFARNLITGCAANQNWSNATMDIAMRQADFEANKQLANIQQDYALKRQEIENSNLSDRDKQQYIYNLDLQKDQATRQSERDKNNATYQVLAQHGLTPSFEEEYNAGIRPLVTNLVSSQGNATISANKESEANSSFGEEKARQTLRTLQTPAGIKNLEAGNLATFGAPDLQKRLGERELNRIIPLGDSFFQKPGETLPSYMPKPEALHPLAALFPNEFGNTTGSKNTVAQASSIPPGSIVKKVQPATSSPSLVLPETNYNKFGPMNIPQLADPPDLNPTINLTPPFYQMPQRPLRSNFGRTGSY